jgi:heme exporter protein B
MGALIKRDILLAWRSGGAWLLGVIFFLLFITFCVIAAGGEAPQLDAYGPAYIWLALLFATLLSFGAIFSDDLNDGTLEQLVLSGLTSFSVTVAKWVAFMILTIGPVFILLPVVGVMLGLSVPRISGLALSVLFATPALAAYGVMAGALMAWRGKGGFLIILISAPFLIPVLIFGLAAVDSYARFGISAYEFRALGGLSLIAMAIGLPAASAALTANLE